jgi:hypothetical protein
VGAIRALMVARRSAAGERTRTNGQARALILTGPDDLRARFTRHTPAALVSGLASLRPRPGDVAGYAVRVALRELGRRAQFPDGQLGRLDELIVPLVTARARACSPCTGSGPAPPRCCSSQPGTIPDGSAPTRPGRTCAAPPRSPRHRGKSPATGTAPGCDKSAPVGVPGQTRGAYSIERNGQSRSSHARTAWYSTGSSVAWSARTQELTAACWSSALGWPGLSPRGG